MSGKAESSGQWTQSGSSAADNWSEWSGQWSESSEWSESNRQWTRDDRIHFLLLLKLKLFFVPKALAHVCSPDSVKGLANGLGARELTTVQCRRILAMQSKR